MTVVTEQSGEGAAPAEPSFSVVAPKVELPKGGGAIRGIGEKFAANPVTGTANMSVPIAVSAGRSGFGPELTLSYDSGAGNGVFGFGWSLGSPQIARKTDRGLPRYDDAGESDVFVLSGAEDLVPVMFDRRRHADSSSYPGYTIRRYRPRVESQFARIERWTRDSDGDTHWRSISGDNVLTLYGVTPDDRIFDPGDPSHVFSWLVSETRDDKGNAIAYTYKADGSNRHLKRIRYGNRVPMLGPDHFRQPLLAEKWQDSADWMFELVFDYGDHDVDEPTPTESRPWGLRADSFSARRAGFEVRTSRRCERVLMFHHFLELTMPTGCVVRSTDLHYDVSDVYSFLTSVTHSGWRRVADAYVVRSMPPAEFEYSRPQIGDEVKVADTSAGLPMGIDGAIYRMVDLDGYGASGVLTEQAGTWYYSRNLSPLAPGKVVFAAPSPVPSKPNLSLGSGGAQFVDLAGDGLLDLAVLDPPLPGFYELDPAVGWAPFRPIDQALNRNLNAPNVKLIDITGDGHTDVLIIDGNEFVWHESLGEEGFGPENKVWQALDNDDGPRLVFTDPTSSVFLADMTGDGLTDLVQVSNSEVCYWPSLGYGAFGSRIVMGILATAGGEPALSVCFDRPERFDPARVLLADIDGSGTNDVIYLAGEGVEVYFNACGNALTSPIHLPVFPKVSNGTRVSTIDLNGDGTACLVWSSSLPADAPSPLRYVELMAAGKPHLMVRALNNLGAETQVSYTTSTALALQADLAGKPWRTRVSFPVHVVDKVVTRDHLSGNRFTTSYHYRDGHFDGEEREFRGFARVDQLDTEEIAALTRTGQLEPASNEERAHNVPPVLTRTWFHTGAMVGDPRLTRAMEEEYFTHPALDGWLLDDTVLPGVPDDQPLSTLEAREAVRSLKGSMLRSEVYALDSPQATLEEPGEPYAITEQNLQIVCLQRLGDGPHAVFFTHPRETISHHVERNPEDPRTTHTLILDVDGYGNVLREAWIAYGRRPAPLELGMTADDQERQQLIHMTVTERQFTESLVDSVNYYRTPLPAEEVTYEVRKPVQEKTGDPNLAVPFRFVDLEGWIDQAGDGIHDIEYEDLDFARAAKATQEDETGKEGTRYFRRVIEHLRTLYRSDDLHANGESTGLLPLRKVQSRALAGESYKLAFTKGLLDAVYQRSGEPLLPDAAHVLADEGGYVAGEAGSWWIPSGRTFLIADNTATPEQELAFAASHFFLPRRYQDPFGHNTVVDFDNHDLLVVSSQDAVENVVTSETADDDGRTEIRIDYRVLKPFWVTDPNGNRTCIAFDTLGLVAGTAVMGKPGDGDGDLIGDDFEVDLTQEQLDALHHDPDPAGQAARLLGDATTRIVYDLSTFQRSAYPAYAATIVRETHVGDVPPPHGHRFQLGFSYSDGFGREIQKKVQAEPGPLAPGGPEVRTRWVGSGWTVFNNKGKPVRQYEPFFSATHHYEFGVVVGVSPVLFYDPVDRPIATLHPNHTFEKVVFNPWRQTTYDVNDTCAAPVPKPDDGPSRVTGDPRTDPDIGRYVADYFTTQPDWQTWHAQRIDKAMGEDEQNGARRAAAHADTPTRAYFDALGRAFLTIARNRVECLGHKLHNFEEDVATRVEYDIEGNQRAVRDAIRQAGDPLGRIVMRYSYDLLGNRVHQLSMEAGARWMLKDVAGQPIRAWDSRGHDFATRYDALRRPVAQTVRGTIAAESDPRTLGRQVLFDRIEYGEGLDNAKSLNLRTRAYRHFDSAGIATNARLDASDGPIEAYDYKGNLLHSTRRLVTDYKGIPDWSQEPQLDDEFFMGSTRYDAVNRAIQSVAPRSSLGRGGFNVIQHVFNEANLLERVDVWLERSTAPDALLGRDTEPASPVGVNNIDYDAKGQRLRIDYKNGATTTYDYDPLTFRLTALVTKRRAKDFPGDDPRPPIKGWPGRYLQNLHYTYDPAGNITHIQDDAQQAIFFRNKRVEPSNDYVYDATYRLIQATGREHLGQGGVPIPHSHNDAGRVGIVSTDNAGRFAPNDGKAMGVYTERYVYDAVGNFAEMQHRGGDPKVSDWTRAYHYLEPSLIEDGAGGLPLKMSNRLTRTTLNLAGNSRQPEAYLHDAHGNMLRMPHLGAGQPGTNMHWDYMNRLRQVDLGGGGAAYCIYDASGNRVRKAWEKSRGLIEERIYLGGFEVFRAHGAPIAEGRVKLERETLHAVDENRSIAIIETLTVYATRDEWSPRRLIRYQFGSHLGSSNLETDDRALIVSHEEYSPYGNTTYQAVRAVTDAPKRYRFSASERDNESGLDYHRSRYYAPWLGRWASSDLIDIGDGVNLFTYVSGRPVSMTDREGRSGVPIQRGLTISPNSKISAKRLLEMIQKSEKMPKWMKEAFAVKGNTLTLASRVKVRPDDIPAWFKSAAAAIQSGQWHMTTGAAVVANSLERPEKRLVGDHEPGDEPRGGPKVDGVMTGETIESRPIGEYGRKMLDSAAGGDENPGYRRPGKEGAHAEGIVIVADRFRSVSDPRVEIERSDDSILESLFHELAAHAGQHTLGKGSDHASGDYRRAQINEVDDLARDVDRHFGSPDERDKIKALSNAWERAKGSLNLTRRSNDSNGWERLKKQVAP